MKNRGLDIGFMFWVFCVLGGCLGSPNNESVWSGTDAPIPFAGLAAAGPVCIYASVEATTDLADLERIA